ncbi:MAG: FlgD immunoglobulin-like domain containing protein [Candidatus Krumholzibacteriota bacterium]
MMLRVTLIVLGVVGILVLAAYVATAAGPVATPDGIFKGERGEIPAVVDKAFGEPTDFKASALAGADYIRYMQADITEDNAGNGDPDFPVDDPDDAGWDWILPGFEHSANASAPNVYGVCANAAYQAYLIEADPALFTTMKDAADYIVTAGPASIRSAADMVFLLDFATLPAVTSPLTYQNGAAAIWAYRLANYGGTATSFAEGLRDYRGNHGWPNGIIPWDLAPYVTSLMRLETLFPGNNYASDAAEIVEVIYQDSFNANPGFFEPHVATSKGWDPTGTDSKFWLYPAGVAGIITAFQATGLHLAEIPALETVMLECQYADGAYSFQYGAETSFDDRDWQVTAYCVFGLWDFMAHTPANLASLYDATAWLAATQDASGGWVYGSGDHYPEISGESAAAVAYGWFAAGAALNTTATGADPALCGVTKTVTFDYDRGEATPGLFGYEVVLQITGPVTAVVAGDFTEITGMDFFTVVDDGGGQFTVNGTRFGADPGILTDADLFSVDLTTAGDGTVDVSILSYRFRDPVNTFIFADMNGMDFVVDCTAPGPVADIAAAPRHNKVDVTWTHDGTDTATYEIYRGLWYDTAVGVSAYPEYDDLGGNTIPARPADRDAAIASGEWAYAGAVAVGTLNFTDVWPDETSRGVYYYEVFAVDTAGNGGAAAAANDRSTNYWLGDVPPYIDGFVDVDDITVLGACFATSHGGAFYNNMCDVGPTDDWSRLGIPLTDSLIDFEDLMVFSMNYSVVGPAKTDGLVSRTIDLAWIELEDGRWALHLLGGSGLKGVRVRAAVPVSAVTVGELPAAQPEMTFLVNTGSAMDVNLALMGRGLGFVGTGELFVLEAGAAIAPEDLVIDLRGTDNSKLDYTLDKVGGSATPMVFNLGANYPNPFNPLTRISFSLPEARDVVMAVYSLDGRRVATLLNETRGAGDHEVVWMGRDDAGQLVASGTYFYRIDAGPYSQVRKMTLMK